MEKGFKKPLLFLVFGERTGLGETDYYYYTDLKDAVEKAEEFKKEEGLVALHIVHLVEDYIETTYF